MSILYLPNLCWKTKQGNTNHLKTKHYNREEKQHRLGKQVGNDMMDQICGT